MLGSFLGGIIGALMQLTGFVLFLVYLVMMASVDASHDTDSLLLIVVLAAVMLLVGSYLRYLSRHTVRVRG